MSWTKQNEILMIILTLIFSDFIVQIFNILLFFLSFRLSLSHSLLDLVAYHRTSIESNKLKWNSPHNLRLTQCVYVCVCVSLSHCILSVNKWNWRQLTHKYKNQWIKSKMHIQIKCQIIQMQSLVDFNEGIGEDKMPLVNSSSSFLLTKQKSFSNCDSILYIFYILFY